MNFQALLARLRTAGAALSGAQIASLAAVFVAVVGLVVGSAYWINTPTYGVLFSDMDPESANGVVTRLKNDKVPYTLDEGGRTIRVPVARLDELRLQVAGQGLPASGRIGFEIFDRTSFGVTDFLEHVNYRRALEGELARTIGTIAEVSSARVHIAMARPSLFASQDQAATASVVLKLRGNKPLSATTTAAISGLIAAGVEGLRPEAVVIIDNFGRPLTRSTDGRDEATGAFQVERQQRIERDLSTRVVSLLEPIVGPAHVRVNISAKLNTDSQEETVERFDPTPVVRSHQSVVQGGTAAGAAQGVAGVRSNMPPPAPAPRRRRSARSGRDVRRRRWPRRPTCRRGPTTKSGRSRPIAFSRKARSPSCRWPCCSTTIAPAAAGQEQAAVGERDREDPRRRRRRGRLRRGARRSTDGREHRVRGAGRRGGREAALVAPLLAADARCRPHRGGPADRAARGVRRDPADRAADARRRRSSRVNARIAAPQGRARWRTSKESSRPMLEEDDEPAVPRRLPALTRRVAKADAGRARERRATGP